LPAAQPLVGNSNAQHLPHQRVTGRVRQSQEPRDQVPNDCGGQEGKDHRITTNAAHVQDQIDRPQRDDAVGDRPGRYDDTDEVARPRPDDRDDWLQGMGIDDRRDSVCRIVKPVYEFEPQSDQEREPEKRECTDRQGLTELSRVENDTGSGIYQACE
jgi:hypothetical protein